MPWSRVYEGTPDAVAAQVQADRANLEASLPPWERDQVVPLVAAVEALLEPIPPASQITLALSGHAISAARTQAGGVNIQLSYHRTVTPTT